MDPSPAQRPAETSDVSGSADDSATAEPGLFIDLGCGLAKTEGFIGVDRFALPGVDVVCDLDSAFPFPDDSASYIIASHSLEHVADLAHVLAEIYRICRDRAIVTMVAPYHATSLNEANPYHKQVFNEHTARFFTNAFSIPTIAAVEFEFPHAKEWGAIESDHSAHRIDIRPLRQEFFYFPAFRGLPEGARRVLRQHLANVCDQMLLHAVVVKSPISDDELRQLASSTDFVETAALKARRELEATPAEPGNIFAELFPLRDAVGELHGSFHHLRSRLDNLEGQMVALHTHAESQTGKLQSGIAELSQAVADLRSRVAGGDLQAAISVLEGQVGGLTSRLAAGEARAENLAFRMGGVDARSERQEAQTDKLRSKTADMRKRVAALEAEAAERGSQAGKAERELRARVEDLAASMAEFAYRASMLEEQSAAIASRVDDVHQRSGDIDVRTELLEQDALVLNGYGAALEGRLEARLTEFNAALQRIDEWAGVVESRVGTNGAAWVDVQSHLQMSREQVAGLQGRLEAGDAEVSQLRAVIADLSQQMEDLREDQERTGIRKGRARDSGRFQRVKEVARTAMRRGDLAPLVAPNFRALLEASLLSNSIDRRHRLALSPVLGRGSLLAYELPMQEGTLLGVEIALSLAKITSTQQMDLAYDLFDAERNMIVFAGSRRINALTVAAPVILACSPVAIARPSRMFLRLAGSAELGRSQARVYEWQRVRWRTAGPRIERQLFGRMLRPTAAAPTA